MPLLFLIASGTAACDIVAVGKDCFNSAKTDTDTSGKVRDSTKVCAFDSSLSLKPMTAPPVEACLKCVGLFPG